MFFVTTTTTIASARDYSCKGSGPNMFETAEQCTTALLSGECKFYEPRYKYSGPEKKGPIDGVLRIKVPSERNQCVLMITVSGKKWVAQREGTNFRHMRDGKGNLNPTPYARDDCENPVYAISVPSTELPQAIKVVEAPRPQVVRCEKPLILELRDDGSIACIQVVPEVTKVAEAQPPPQPAAQNPCAPGGVYGVDQNGRRYCDYAHQEAMTQNYSWVPWVIGAGALAVISNSRSGRDHYWGGSSATKV